MNPLSWERRTPKEVLAHWKTSETTGLSEKEAAKRRSTYGTNELAHKKPESLFVSFLNQMKDFMIITLLIAALISFLVRICKGRLISLNRRSFWRLSFSMLFSVFFRKHVRAAHLRRSKNFLPLWHSVCEVEIQNRSKLPPSYRAILSCWNPDTSCPLTPDY